MDSLKGKFAIMAHAGVALHRLCFLDKKKPPVILVDDLDTNITNDLNPEQEGRGIVLKEMVYDGVDDFTDDFLPRPRPMWGKGYNDNISGSPKHYGQNKRRKRKR